jgi:DNA-binding response OmpR family regulator
MVDEATVLVVDDEPDVIDRYEDYLADTCRVRMATDGDAAMAELDESVDAVLLDRRMPGTTGDEVLGMIEARGLDPRIALVTAVSPDFDIVDLHLDDYLVKPVTKAEVHETVERLLLIDEYSARRRELNALQVKRNVLQVEKSTAELEASREYRDLVADIEALESRVAALTDSLEGTPLERYS